MFLARGLEGSDQVETLEAGIFLEQEYSGQVVAIFSIIPDHTRRPRGLYMGSR
jgi:hypothetical protein